MNDTSFNEEIKKEVKTHLERTQMHIYHTRPQQKGNNFPAPSAGSLHGLVESACKSPIHFPIIPQERLYERQIHSLETTYG